MLKFFFTFFNLFSHRLIAILREIVGTIMTEKQDTENKSNFVPGILGGAFVGSLVAPAALPLLLGAIIGGAVGAAMDEQDKQRDKEPPQ